MKIFAQLHMTQSTANENRVFQIELIRLIAVSKQVLHGLHTCLCVFWIFNFLNFFATVHNGQFY